MRKLTKFVLSVFTGVMMLGMTAFASEFSVIPANAVFYTNPNTIVLMDASADAQVILPSCESNLPIQVTGITSNGYWQISLGGETYYVAGIGLSETTGNVTVETPEATTITPAQNAGKYVCVIEEGDKELLASKTVDKFNLTPRADWTNDYYYNYFRDELETALASGKTYHKATLGATYEPMCRVFKNLMVDFLKAHPEVKFMGFSNYCPTASYSNPNDGTEYCEYSISYDLVYDKYGNTY